MKSVSLASIMVLAFLTAGCSSYYTGYRPSDWKKLLHGQG